MKNTVKIERAKKDYTQEKLASLVGVSRQTINAIEKKNYIPSAALAIKISNVFNTSVNEIFFLDADD